MTTSPEDLLKDFIEHTPSSDQSFFSLKSFTKYPLQLFLGVVGLGLLVLGLAYFFKDFQKTSSVEIIPVQENQEKEESTIFVHVSGAVEKPGLYQLPQGSRINDALVQAGGISQKANRGWFEENINLAQKITDGSKIYIPFFNQTSGFVVDSQTLGSQSGLVNINTADSSELESLPKIGKVTAGKIISWRQKNNSFQTKEDLLKISGFSEKMLTEIKDLITL